MCAILCKCVDNGSVVCEQEPWPVLLPTLSLVLQRYRKELYYRQG